MRLLICAGGTGGGVYPALVALQALSERVNATTLWVGGIGGMEAGLVVRMGIPFQAIPAAGIHGVGIRSLPKNIIQLVRGFLVSRWILRTFQPDVIFFTGGYVAVPMAMASRLPLPNTKRPRSLVYIPDIEPGLALKAIIRFADRAALTVEDTRSYLPHGKKAITTGYPVRPELARWTRKEGRKALGLDEDTPVLLVTGGSRGSRAINRELSDILPHLLKFIQVIHITGEYDWPEAQKRAEAIPSDISYRYKAYPYLHEELGAAMASADLVVSRAGASTLGEYPIFGLPAILIPYPYAWRYQKVNASYLEERGAAVMIKEEDVPEKLLKQILFLFRNPDRLEKMRQSMLSLSNPGASEAISQQLIDLAEDNLAEKHPAKEHGQP